MRHKSELLLMDRFWTKHCILIDNCQEQVDGARQRIKSWEQGLSPLEETSSGGDFKQLSELSKEGERADFYSL